MDAPPLSRKPGDSVARTRSGQSGPEWEGRLPLLAPRPGGIAERFAHRLSGRHPAAVFAAALILGFALAAVLSIAFGLFVTDVVIRTGGIGVADENFVESLVADRTSLLTDASAVGSTVGSIVLVALAALVAIVFAIRKQWAIAAFAAFTPVVESGLYRGHLAGRPATPAGRRAT